MELTFKDGDKVKLKTGGEVMTVIRHLTNIADVVSGMFKEKRKDIELENVQAVLCEWFEEGKKKRGNFLESQLILVEDSD